MQFRYIDDDIRTGDAVDRPQAVRLLRAVQPVAVAVADLDQRHDRAGDRLRQRAAGHRHDASTSARRSIRPIISTCMLNQNQSWVNVDDAAGASRRLFIARVSRVRGTYTFTSRLFVRGIAQYVSTDRDPSLYTFSDRSPKSGTVSGQVLLSYKLNWQSVMFIGYGDDRMLSTAGSLREGRPSVLRQALLRPPALSQAETVIMTTHHIGRIVIGCLTAGLVARAGARPSAQSRARRNT